LPPVPHLTWSTLPSTRVTSTQLHSYLKVERKKIGRQAYSFNRQVQQLSTCNGNQVISEGLTPKTDFVICLPSWKYHMHFIQGYLFKNKENYQSYLCMAFDGHLI
ncbi:hypothetical protein AALO_G00187500, partial [Alosa alosa]